MVFVILVLLVVMNWMSRVLFVVGLGCCRFIRFCVGLILVSVG